MGLFIFSLGDTNAASPVLCVTRIAIVPDMMANAGPFHLNQFKQILLVGLSCLFLATLVHPPYPEFQLLLHVATFSGLGLLLTLNRIYRFSDASFARLFAFMALHIFASRWLYSNVPYDQWTGWAFGFSLSDFFHWRRNHFDRVVHFFFGIFFVRPVREILVHYVKGSPLIQTLAVFQTTIGVSFLYEIVEWLFAVILAPDQAEAFNGQQGDIWDAHKDMLAALIGSVIACAWSLFYIPDYTPIESRKC